MASLAFWPATFRAWSADSVTPPAGLVAWWPGEGNAVDIAGTNNGALFNGVGFVPGMVGQAFSFNGTNSYVEVPDSPSLRLTNVLSLEFWVQRQDLQVDAYLLNKGGDYTRGALNYGVTLNAAAYNDALAFTFAGGFRRSASIGDTNWHHVAVVAHNGDADPTFYVDGVQKPVTARGGPSTIKLYPSTEALHIGAQVDPLSGWSIYSKAIVDELSIYNRALSAAEIQTIYTAGSAGKRRSPYAATATATVVNDFVVEATVTDGGWGYTNTPAVRILGGGGSGAQAVTVVSNGVVIAVNVLNTGNGYTNTPVIVIEPPFIPQPTMGIAAMSLLSFTNLALGTNYQFQVLLGNTWSNLGAAFTAASPTITQYVSGTADPSRYHLASTPLPLQAHATAQLVNGFVVGVTVTSGGSGYITTPAVTIVGGGGTNATAAAHVSAGRVTSITITSPGSGYMSPPTIQIASPPPGVTLSPTVLPVMRLDSANLAPYDNYQIQFKPDIGGAWENWDGGLFSPTDVTNSQYLFITNGVGFFRLRYVP